MALIPERPFLWMTERQRRALRLQASHITGDLANAGRHPTPRDWLLARPRRSYAFPLARVVRR